MIEKYELHDKIDFKASFCMKQCSAEGVAVTINGEKERIIIPKGSAEKAAEVLDVILGEKE